MLDRVGPGTLTLEDPSGKIDVRRRNGQGDSLYTSRGNVAAVIAAVLAEPASVGKVIPFGDGSRKPSRACRRSSPTCPRGGSRLADCVRFVCCLALT